MPSPHRLALRAEVAAAIHETLPYKQSPAPVTRLALPTINVKGSGKVPAYRSF